MMAIVRPQRVVLAALLAMAMAVAGLAFGAAPASANDERGECLYVEGAPDTIELSDLTTSASRISMRRNGKWVRTIDATQTTFQVRDLNQQGGSWIARVFPKGGGDRYDLTCVSVDPPPKRTSCTVRFGDDAQLRFPGIDARRIIVRVNGKWRATLAGDADRWTDPSPKPDADYIIRVRESNGSKTDIACLTAFPNFEFSASGEVTNGGFLPFGFVPAPSSDEIDEIDLSAATGLDGQNSTDTSYDGSAVLVSERGLATEPAAFRVHLASRSVDKIDRVTRDAVSLDHVSISDDGDTVAYVRPGGQLRVRTYDGADRVSDRWILEDSQLASISLSGSGDFVIIEREVANGVELVRVNLKTRAKSTVYEADEIWSFDASSDASRLMVYEGRSDQYVTVAEVGTGEQTRFELTSDRARPGGIRVALSGDGSTLALGQWCLEVCPLEVIDLDSGARRVFIGRELILGDINHDGNRILVAEDEFEGLAVIDIAKRDLTLQPVLFQHLYINGNSTDGDFTIAVGESQNNQDGLFIAGIGIG